MTGRLEEPLVRIGDALPIKGGCPRWADKSGSLYPPVRSHDTLYDGHARRALRVPKLGGDSDSRRLEYPRVSHFLAGR
jgi:hypothetical protein